MNIKVLLLAAGRSSRMKPFEDKNFLNFLGKPLLQWQLELLLDCGLREIVVVARDTNIGEIEELIEKLSTAMGSKTSEEIKISVCEQTDDLGMCGAVLAAEDLVLADSEDLNETAQNDQAVLIFSSNDLVESSALATILQEAGVQKSITGDGGENALTVDEISSTNVKSENSKKIESFIIGKKVEEYFPGGYLETDENGLLKNIVEKPGAGNEPSDLINLVVHLHRNPARLIKYLKNVKSTEDDLYEVALAEMMRDGIKMKALPYDGFWQAIKYPWHLLPAFQFLLARKIVHRGDFQQSKQIEKPKISSRFSVDEQIVIGKNVQIAENVTIKGPVVIDDNVKIFENAVIKGPVYLGKNTIVANNALVRDAHVGADSVVGFGTEIARSYLDSEVWTHSNYLGDSFLGRNISFGAGAVTGNLRLDEANISVNIKGIKTDSGQNKLGAIIGNDVRVGINTSLMPGIKIGHGCSIGAGIVVGQDIADLSFVRADSKAESNQLKISKNLTDNQKLRRK